MSKQQGADMSSNQAEQDAAWIEGIEASYIRLTEGDKGRCILIAARIREREEHHKGTLEYIEYYRDRMQHWQSEANKPHNIELGPATLAELRVDAALTVVANWFDGTYDAEVFASRARHLAAAMTPGEGETTSAKDLRAFNDVLRKNRELQQRIAELDKQVISNGERKTMLTLLKGVEQERDELQQRIQELTAERDRSISKAEELDQRVEQQKARLTSATKLLERCQHCITDGETRDGIDTWLKGQPEEATPPLDAEKVVGDTVCEVCGHDNPVWFTDNDLWNKYAGDYQILCPICFVRHAEGQGLECTGWKLVPEEVARVIRKEQEQGDE